MNVNRVILAGNLTRDPQVQSLPTGTSLCEFSVAVNRKYKTQDGQQREDVSFFDCRAFGRLAENIGKFFSKGRPIFIEGRLEQNRWEQDGQQRSRVRVVAESFEFVGGREDQ